MGGWRRSRRHTSGHPDFCRIPSSCRICAKALRPSRPPGVRTSCRHSPSDPQGAGGQAARRIRLSCAAKREAFLPGLHLEFSPVPCLRLRQGGTHCSMRRQGQGELQPERRGALFPSTFRTGPHTRSSRPATRLGDRPTRQGHSPAGTQPFEMAPVLERRAEYTSRALSHREPSGRSFDGRNHCPCRGDGSGNS